MKFVIDCTVNDCKYLDDILCALARVDIKYVLYPSKDNYKYPERVFAYEFYHQYRIIMEEKKEKYKDLYLNGEQPKSSLVWEGLAMITPDLVLHGKVGEEDNTGESQKWLCEIKMISNFNVIDDLEKIKEGESILKFQHYILLYVGATLQNLKDKLENKNKDKEKLDCNTLCICAFYDEDGVQLTCRRLYEIINN